VIGCAIRKERRKTKENKNTKRKTLSGLSLLSVCVVESRIERTKENKLKEEKEGCSRSLYWKWVSRSKRK
jgi:hypothetical protein